MLDGCELPVTGVLDVNGSRWLCSFAGFAGNCPAFRMVYGEKYSVAELRAEFQGDCLRVTYGSRGLHTGEEDVYEFEPCGVNAGFAHEFGYWEELYGVKGDDKLLMVLSDEFRPVVPVLDRVLG